MSDRLVIPEGSRVPEGVASQTFLRHFDRCRRAAYLYETTPHVPSAAMLRGTAMHAVFERATQAMIDGGEKSIPPEVCKAIVDEVLGEFDVELADQDYLRMCAYRWAAEFECAPDEVVANEQLVELDVGGLTVRMRIDFATLTRDGSTLVVKDWKSSRAMPSQDEVASKRPDGSLSAKSFQLVLYALGLVFGVPVRREMCLTCDGAGGKRSATQAKSATGVVYEITVKCPTCRGAGYAEMRDPFPLAPRAQMIDLAFVYPGIEEKKGPRQGLMAERRMTLTVLELHEYLSSLAALGERVRSAVESGSWDAKPGSHCAECPAPLLCPIAPDLRAFQTSEGVAAAGHVNTPEEARTRAELVDRADAVVGAWKRELREWSKAHGGEPIQFGTDLEFAFVASSATKISDRDEMLDAIRRAVEFGEAFDPGRYVKTGTSTRWTKRKRMEGSDG